MLWPFCVIRLQMIDALYCMSNFLRPPRVSGAKSLRDRDMNFEKDEISPNYISYLISLAFFYSIHPPSFFPSYWQEAATNDL